MTCRTGNWKITFCVATNVSPSLKLGMNQRCVNLLVPIIDMCMCGILQVRPLLFHRWGGLGNHRYQVGFSGDVMPVSGNSIVSST